MTEHELLSIIRRQALVILLDTDDPIPPGVLVNMLVKWIHSDGLIRHFNDPGAEFFDEHGVSAGFVGGITDSEAGPQFAAECAIDSLSYDGFVFVIGEGLVADNRPELPARHRLHVMDVTDDLLDQLDAVDRTEGQ